MNVQEAEQQLSRYAAFAPFLTEEAKRRPSWKVTQIAQALREGPRPNASETFVRNACESGELRAVNASGSVGWIIYREDLLAWLVDTMLPDSAGKTGTESR